MGGGRGSGRSVLAARHDDDDDDDDKMTYNAKMNPTKLRFSCKLAWNLFYSIRTF